MGESNTEFQDYLKNANVHSFFLTETTPDEVDSNLKKIDTKKASDLFGISPLLVKSSSEKVKNQLSIVFNASFGIRNTQLKWFDSYLTDRQQRVKIGENTSDYKTVK